jgi:signal recognition particle receptor subunit beta
MPRIDERTGDIVIRIVYDGMPEAGKTTNIQRLFAAIPLQRRGSLASPETTGRRTEFFDWLDFAGGFVDGRRIRCQLVSVPGQPQLLHRRKYLLDAADVVVFVADSQSDSVAANRESVTTLIALLEAIDPKIPAALVVQANKQDLPGALRPRALAVELDVPVGTPVIPAVAEAGRGVMDTFVLAARLASDRVRALMLGDSGIDALAEHESSADALHVAMVALETPAPATRRTVTREDVHALVRARANDVASARACRIPRPESLLAGHVWPPVKGRAAVAAAAVGDVAIPDRAIDWAPAEPIEIALEDGWLLHSASSWTFESEGDARMELMSMVRRLVAVPELVPEGRALFVGAAESGYRLWMLTPPIPSLASRLLDALVERDVQAARTVFDDCRRARAALVGAKGIAAVPGGASGVATQDGRVVVLALGEGGDVVDEHALALALRATADDSEGRACVDAAYAQHGAVVSSGSSERQTRTGGRA